MNKQKIKGLEKYSDKWVALNSNRTKVVAGGKNLKKVLEMASKKVDKPVLMRVPSLDATFSP